MEKINHWDEQESIERRLKKRNFHIEARSKIVQASQCTNMKLLPSTMQKFQRGRRRRNLIRNASFLITLFLVVLCLLPQPQQVDGAKKLKKAAKEIAKGIIYSKLTSRKNFLPVPLPIPGKWQQMVHLMADNNGALAAIVAASGGGGTKGTSGYTGGSSRKYIAGSGDSKSSASASSSSSHSVGPSKKFDIIRKSLVFSGNDESAGKKLLLFGASNFVNTLASVDSATGGKVSSIAKIFGASGSLKPLGAPSATPSAVDMHNVKKLTRLAAAKYAKRIISTETVGKHGKPSKSSSATSKVASSLAKKAATTLDSSVSKNKRNDVLVTAFNVVKLAQQIKELDPTKLLNFYKKSSLSSASSSSNRVPIVSMNINNRKTILNMLHYIHKLTSDLNHRHRNNRNLLAATN